MSHTISIGTFGLWSIYTIYTYFTFWNFRHCLVRHYWYNCQCHGGTSGSWLETLHLRKENHVFFAPHVEFFESKKLRPLTAYPGSNRYTLKEQPERFNSNSTVLDNTTRCFPESIIFLSDPAGTGSKGHKKHSWYCYFILKDPTSDLSRLNQHVHHEANGVKNTLQNLDFSVGEEV